MEIAEYKCEVCKHKDKATAIEPLWIGNGSLETAVFNKWMCLSCCSQHEAHNRFKYCPECGQRIDWSKEHGE